MYFLEAGMTGSLIGWPSRPSLELCIERSTPRQHDHRACCHSPHSPRWCTPKGHLAVAAAGPIPSRRRPPPASPLELRAPLALLERPRGLAAPPCSVRKVLGPRGDPGRKGQPWQRPAGRPFWSDPVRRPPPPPPVASSLRGPLACGDPVPHRPAVRAGMARPCPPPAGRPIWG